MFWYSGHMHGWGWVVMIFAMVAFWGLLIWVILAIGPRGGRPGSLAQVPLTPEQLLAGRFARGDIDEPEYSSRLAALHRPPRS